MCEENIIYTVCLKKIIKQFFDNWKVHYKPKKWTLLWLLNTMVHIFIITYMFAMLTSLSNNGCFVDFWWDGRSTSNLVNFVIMLGCK